jgi:enoyl-[acyl-carrier protein] reductase II
MEGVEQVEGGRKFSQRCVEVALEEEIPVAITSVGPPNVYTSVLKNAGVKVLHAVSTVGHAKKAEDHGGCNALSYGGAEA